MDNSKLKKTSLVVALCLFMELLDATILTTATPAIASSFGVSVSSVSITITAYMITLAVFIPLSGWLAERFNRRSVFLSAIFIFTIASLGCAVSPSFSFLVVMRIIQGIGGSMMVPVGRLIVIEKTPKKNLIEIISYLVWPGLIAPAIAPLVGGIIVTYASWHWIFMINVPIGLIAFFISSKLMDSNIGDNRIKLDWLGFILTGIGAGGLVYSSNILADANADWSKGFIFLLLSIFELGFTVYYLKNASNPLIKLDVLKVKTFRISQLGGSFFWFSVGSAPFLLTMLFQNQFKWSAAYAGSIVLFIFVGNISIKPASTFLLNHFGFKRVFVVSIILVIFSMIFSSMFTRNTPLFLIIIITVISGMGRSLTFTSYNTISFSELDEKDTKDANTLSSTTQNMAQAIGIALVSIVLRIGASLESNGINELISYKIAFIMLAIFALCSLIEIIPLPKKLGDEILSN